MRIWIVALAAVAVGLIVLTGCRERRQMVVVHEQHPVAVEREVVAPPDEVIIVQEPPPAVIIERRPRPPGPTYVWISGYYVYEGRHYVWRQGRYEVPPRRGQVYEQDRWQKTEHGYQRSPGHWRN